MDIRPTHTCFDDVVEYMTERVTLDPKLAFDDRFIIVHGIAMSEKGECYAHAWVEEGGLCWEAGVVEGNKVRYSVEVTDFYRMRRIQKTTRYTIAQALLTEMDTGVPCGPWVTEYKALCLNGKEPRILGKVAVERRSLLE